MNNVMPINYETIALASMGGIRQASETKPLVLEHYDDLEPSAADHALIEGAFDLNGLAVIYGPSNCGKTFWTMDVALHIAAGMEWRGNRVQSMPVLYLALEGGRGAVNRVVAWRKTQGVLSIPFYLVRSNVNLLDPNADAQAVIDAAFEIKKQTGHDVGLIVVDTLARAMAGGNENAPEDMGALVGNADRIRDETKAALWFVHHSGKDEAKGARGHSSLRAATDTEIEIAILQEAGHRTARATKQREMEMGDSWAFQLEPVTLLEPPQRKAVTSCTVVQMDGAPAQTHGGRASISGQAKRAFEVLCDVINAAGRDHPGSISIPAGMVVSVTDWRSEYYARANPGEHQDTKRKAFTRSLNDLLGKKIVGCYEETIWLI